MSSALRLLRAPFSTLASVAGGGNDKAKAGGQKAEVSASGLDEDGGTTDDDDAGSRMDRKGSTSFETAPGTARVSLGDGTLSEQQQAAPRAHKQHQRELSYPSTLHNVNVPGITVIPSSPEQLPSPRQAGLRHSASSQDSGRFRSSPASPPRTSSKDRDQANSSSDKADPPGSSFFSFIPTSLPSVGSLSFNSLLPNLKLPGTLTMFPRSSSDSDDDGDEGVDEMGVRTATTGTRLGTQRLGAGGVDAEGDAVDEDEWRRRRAKERMRSMDLQLEEATLRELLQKKEHGMMQATSREYTRSHPFAPFRPSSSPTAYSTSNHLAVHFHHLPNAPLPRPFLAHLQTTPSPLDDIANSLLPPLAPRRSRSPKRRLSTHSNSSPTSTRSSSPRSISRDSSRGATPPPPLPPFPTAIIIPRHDLPHRSSPSHSAPTSPTTATANGASFPSSSTVPLASPELASPPSSPPQAPQRPPAPPRLSSFGRKPSFPTLTQVESPEFRKAAEGSKVDPVMLHSLVRRGSEKDALRLVRARQEREAESSGAPRERTVSGGSFTRLQREGGRLQDLKEGAELRHEQSTGKPDHPPRSSSAAASAPAPSPAPEAAPTTLPKRRMSLLNKIGIRPKSERRSESLLSIGSTSSGRSGSTSAIPAVPPLPSVGAAAASGSPVAGGAITASPKQSISLEDSPAEQQQVMPQTPSKAEKGKAKEERIQFVKTKAKNKTTRDFGNLFVAQRLYITGSGTPTGTGSNLFTTSPPPLNSPIAEQPTPTGSSSSSGGEPYSNLPGAAASQTSFNTGEAAAGGAPGMGPSSSSQGHGPAPSTPGVKSKKANAVWTAKFSKDGHYLAVGGKDGVVRVYEVLGSQEERDRALRGPLLSPKMDAGGTIDGLPSSPASAAPATPATPATPRSPKLGSTGAATTEPEDPKSAKKQGRKRAQTFAPPAMPVFNPVPLREYHGHTSDILDLAWSKNDFLLSSSMDRSVRLWHVSQPECLCAFQHLDFVTSIAFHPKDDRFFLSGSLDCKLRLWNVPDKKVQVWTDLPELITSVAFTTDGKLAIAGTFVGTCMFFEVETFRFHSFIAAKSNRGKNSKGRKITSITPFPGASTVGERLLIASNDSRMRLFHQVDKQLEVKYVGHENTSSQIKAGFSDDGSYVITGSEDSQVYIFDSGVQAKTDKGISLLPKAKKGESFESFTVSNHITTCAVFAPIRIREILSRSADPVFSHSNSHLAPLAMTLSGSELSPQSTMSNTLVAPVNDFDGKLVSASEDAIIIVTDDESGCITVLRNSPAPSLEKSGSLTSSKALKKARRASRTSMSEA